MDKNVLDALSVIDNLNPHARFLSEHTISTVDDYIDTGSLVLNGIVSGKFVDGGIPRNRITMLAGPSMTGKTFLIMKILANAQKKGLTPVIFDTETAIEPVGAAKMGLDISKVKHVPIFSIEHTRNTIYKFLTEAHAKGVKNKFIIAIDSLDAMESTLQNNRMEKDSTSSDMGSRARAIKSLLRTCSQLAGLTETTFLITNWVYDDPTAMYPSIEKLMPGGKAVVYLPSVTIQLARKPSKGDEGKTMDGELAAGQKSFSGVILRALTVKNRFIKQYLEAEMYLSFDYGLDPYYGLIDIAVGTGAINQSGATYTLTDGTKLGYFKNFRTDRKLWDETIIPAMQIKVNEDWRYSNQNDVPEAEEVDEETEE